MKTLLVPVDFSPVTSQVLVIATDLAKALGGKVVLLHVCEPDVMLVDYALVNFSLARVNEASVKAAAARLAGLQHEVAAGGVGVTVVQAVGSPVEEITTQATALLADYIVIGSHGHGALHDLVAGSTTHGVLRRANCPLVIVPALRSPKARDRDATQEVANQ